MSPFDYFTSYLFICCFCVILFVSFVLTYRFMKELQLYWHEDDMLNNIYSRKRMSHRTPKKKYY